MGKGTTKKSKKKRQASKAKKTKVLEVGETKNDAAVVLKNPSQRHKLEYKALRTKLDQMKKDRLKIRKTDLSQRADRKALTRDIKQEEEEFKARVKAEMDEYEQAVATQQAAQPAPMGETL